ncbi:MAG: hypothetical protein FWC76_06320, partial [Defluviitaleaceae bacterium]|nr:hypothetical protein [Defluviitaleaceae bacterium]
TRISIWSKGHGWQPTNASIVARTYKYGIESYSKMFLCELCSQYVTFVYSEIYNPYFKHPKNMFTISIPSYFRLIFPHGRVARS